MGQIRDATEQDVDAIVELTARSWRVAYRGILPAGYLDDLPLDAWRVNVSEGLRSPTGDSFGRVVELEEGIVGHCYVAAPGREEPPDSHVAEVVAIYVDPKHWGKGVGRALMKSAEAEAAEAGYQGMFLWSFERNAQARAFYARLGYKREGEP
ncbi:MAG: N-acetyltransferase family protein, partial [Solirubrobacterales bacterium]